MNRRELLDRIVRELTDQGRLVEAGVASFRVLVISPDAPPIQFEEMRNAFFAGAQHVFASIMQMMEPGAEPTEKDLQRLTLINIELEEFLAEFKERKNLEK